MRSVGILGAGSWGTALSCVLAKNGYDVTMWGRRESLVDEINRHHTNNSYLPGNIIPAGVKASTCVQKTVLDKDMVFFVVPSHSMREIARGVKDWVRRDAICVSACKGFESGSGMRMSQVLMEELDCTKNIAVLSGPSHAEEVVRECPTTIVVSSHEKHIGEEVQIALSNPFLRVYTNLDMVGVEVGGALKNIIAIGAGLVDGLCFGDNTKAALITRGLAEIIRLGRELGAKPSTFMGLAGIGDLVVTCISHHSRNWKAGHAIGQGMKLEDVLQDIGMVVEGVQTTRVAYELSTKYQVEMPLTEELFNVLFNDKNPNKAVQDLMKREITDELE